VHVKKRAAQRFSILLTDDDYNFIIKMIQNRMCGTIFLEKQSNRVHLWLVKFRKQNLICFYDSIRKSLITLYPIDWYDGEIPPMKTKMKSKNEIEVPPKKKMKCGHTSDEIAPDGGPMCSKCSMITINAFLIEEK